jgi:GntR family transcriptional regulator
VYGVLYQRIRQGTAAPGTTLSTEDQLAAEFGVSKSTIRQAVGALVDRGLVERRQGRGTFVRGDAKAHSSRVFVGSFTDLIVGTHEISVREFSIQDDVVFPSDVREALELDDTTGKTLTHYRDIDGQPFAYAVVYLSPVAVQKLGRDGLVPVGRATRLNAHGVPITGARQSMSAELADVRVAENLEIDYGQPVLFSVRVVYSNDAPIEVVHTWYRGDLYRWEAELDFSWEENGLNITVVAEDDPAARPAPAGRCG